METKATDALIALDIEADMDVNIEFTRKWVAEVSSTVIVGPMADGENDAAYMVAKGRRGHKNLLNGLSVEMSGLHPRGTARRKEQQRPWPRLTV